MIASTSETPIRVGLDWLAVTAFMLPKSFAGFVMEQLLREPLASPDDWDKNCFVHIGQGRRYGRIYSGPLGITLYAYPLSGIHCHLEIKGEAIKFLGQDRLFEFLESLNQLDELGSASLRQELPLMPPVRWDARRLDIAFDGVPFTPRDCYAAYLRGNVRCAANRKSYDWRSNDEGDTLYLGSRSSPRLVRIYDRRGFTRVEIESKGRWASALASILASRGAEDFENFAIGYLRQFLDFVDASKGGSISRAPLLPWWEMFVKDTDKLVLKLIPDESIGSVALRAQAYLARLTPTLCVLKNGLGISLDDVCDNSEYRLKGIHLQKISEIRRGLG